MKTRYAARLFGQRGLYILAASNNARILRPFLVRLRTLEAQKARPVVYAASDSTSSSNSEEAWRNRVVG